MHARWRQGLSSENQAKVPKYEAYVEVSNIGWYGYVFRISPQILRDFEIWYNIKPYNIGTDSANKISNIAKIADIVHMIHLIFADFWSHKPSASTDPTLTSS